MASRNPTSLKLDRGGQPLYAMLAAILRKDIAEGKYPPASSLPTEKELTELYGVSRMTVRQSLRLLREEGLISSHPGIGTIVREFTANNGVFDAVNSTEELLHFVGHTEMHAVSLREVQLDQALAAQLDCQPNLLMSEACFLRKTPGSPLPMSYVRIYVPPRYAEAQLTPPVSNTAIYQRIEQLFNLRVTEIRQDVTATLLDPETAAILQAQPGEAALQMTRFFFDANQTMVQASISFYPASRYKQSARFRVNHNTP